MEVPVLVDPAFRKVSDLREAISTVNQLQSHFGLSLVKAPWLASSDKKHLDQSEIFKKIEKRMRGKPACAVVENPLKRGLFADYDGSTYIFSTADWEAKYSPPPLKTYLIFMIACGVPDLACELPEDVGDSTVHEQPKGCYSDYCGDKESIKFSMNKAHVCKDCKEVLKANGLERRYLTSTEQILRYVRKEMSRYREGAHHDAFISYSSVDRRFAKRLADDLQRNGFNVWLDRFEMAPGDTLNEKILRGIRKCDWFMTLLTPTSVKSPWCRRELDVALNVELKGKIRIVPVLYKRCRVPESLTGKVLVDCGKNYKNGLSSILKTLSKR